jgi:hypothetical protein
MPAQDSNLKDDRGPDRSRGAGGGGKQGPGGRFDRVSRISRSPRRGAGSGSANRQASNPPISAGPGAGDSSSGGGASAGIPGGGTDMRTNPKPVRDADVERDRQKLFPEARTHRDDSDKSA